MTEKKCTVMLSKFKRNKHQQHLPNYPRFLNQLMMSISFTLRRLPGDAAGKNSQREAAHLHVALYLEQDDGGKGILNALYELKGSVRNWMCGCWSTGIVHTWTHWRCGI